MCSIGGFIAKNPLSPDLAQKLADALLWYGTERGRQSAGVYVDGTIIKRAMEPTKFIGIKAYRRIFYGPTSLVLTHTRQPTCGGLGDEQAQPFRSGEAVTIHNGMISNIEHLRTKFGIEKPSGVDSELFASFVAKHGPEALPDFCLAAVGSLAIAAVYQGKLYLVREQSPMKCMTITMRDGNKFSIFASTEHILRMAVGHAFLIPLEYTTYEPDFGGLYAFDAGGLTLVKERKTYGSGSSSDYSREGHEAGFKGSYYDRRYGNGWCDDGDDFDSPTEVVGGVVGRWYKDKNGIQTFRPLVLKPPLALPPRS